ARKRSSSAASEAAPMTSAPRSGALQSGVTEEDAEAGAGWWLIIGISEDFWGRLLTATERFPFPFSRWGMYSSNTAWKLVPPKPKALKPARRTQSAGTVQGFSSVFTYRGEWAKSTSGFGCSQCTLGGRTFSCRAKAAFNRPAAPAADFRCPKFDLTEPMATECAGSCESL